MSLLLLDNVTKRFGAQEVLRGVRFQIDPGQKVGLVGLNGGGKSTLLRLIEGLDKPDAGRIAIPKGTRLGHVPQIPRFEPGQSVRDYVETGMAEAHAIAAELERLGERMGEVSPDELERLMHEHGVLSERLERAGGWETERRVETVLSGIGLDPALWDRPAETMSGGEKSRTALARELVAGHDLLLLDEPTNHLDIEGIEWIESWLKELKGAVLIVSHDRRLLDTAVDSILDLERGRVSRYPGNYSKYLALRTERFEIAMRAWEQQRQRISKEEQFIKKHMGSQRTAEAKGRMKKLRHVERLERPHHDLRRPNIRPPRTERGGELVLEAKGLTGGFDGNVLFSNVDLRIGRGQRIGVVGPNGAGKTTLLRLLAGITAPLSGTVESGHGASVGYYDQDTSILHDDLTPYGEIRRLEPNMTDLEIRSHLALVLFRGNEVEKSVSSLSGGERARLCLAVLMLKKVTWLAMDEPTNHLDLAARTALEEMLGSFDGALVCVSHDREFLDGLCTHIVEVSHGKAVVHTGNYSAWLREKQARAVAQANAKTAQAAKAAKAAKQVAKATSAKKAKSSKQANAQPAPTKKSNTKRPRNPYMFEKLEKRIIELEGQLEALHAACATEEVYKDATRLRDTQVEIAELEDELVRSNEEWENWE